MENILLLQWYVLTNKKILLNLGKEILYMEGLLQEEGNGLFVSGRKLLS
jgi:hypothetical protein